MALSANMAETSPHLQDGSPLRLCDTSMLSFAAKRAVFERNASHHDPGKEVIYQVEKPKV